MNEVLLLDSYFDFFYAKAITSSMYSVFKKMCFGCKKGYLSQMDHSCLSLSDREQLELYFDDIIKVIDEDEILIKWNEAVSCMADISPALIAMYKLKIDCKDWRTADMKNQSWKSKTIKMVFQILRLDKQF